MSVPRYTQLATTALAKAHPPLAASPPLREGRARSIAVIEEAIKTKGQRRTRARRMVGLAAAASIAAAALVMLFLPRAASGPVSVAPLPSVIAPHALAAPQGNVVVSDVVAHAAGERASIENAGDRASANGQAMERGSRLVTGAGGHATLTFSTGTRLTLDDTGDLTLIEGGLTQIVAFGGGRLRAQVAKLGASQRFLVRTVDAEIEVRGTVFRVRSAPSDPACGAGSPTRVAVEEGTVVVRQAGKEATLHAGDTWPRDCATPTPRDLPTPAASTSSPASVEAAAASTLAEQNDSFAAAVAAKNAGDEPTAIALFATFLAKYPGAPLAESATVQRMHLLAPLDRTRAREAAQAYLGAYPKGFARAEAHSILESQP